MPQHNRPCVRRRDASCPDSIAWVTCTFASSPVSYAGEISRVRRHRSRTCPIPNDSEQQRHFCRFRQENRQSFNRISVEDDSDENNNLPLNTDPFGREPPWTYNPAPVAPTFDYVRTSTTLGLQSTSRPVTQHQSYESEQVYTELVNWIQRLKRESELPVASISTLDLLIRRETCTRIQLSLIDYAPHNRLFQSSDYYYTALNQLAYQYELFRVLRNALKLLPSSSNHNHLQYFHRILAAFREANRPSAFVFADSSYPVEMPLQLTPSLKAIRDKAADEGTIDGWADDIGRMIAHISSHGIEGDHWDGCAEAIEQSRQIRASERVPRL
ncbi:uncharacterized protein K452DRAFT_335395 [Aplosporella prunicola CBS 121167]|uniref:Uncharacterized protein n=1 Tax=Aplosporella prunicola CBS 121167 TaxID=1176127 RepID=A0A6A6BAA9_9PEZI|nr:uncharacterized protein K452DRAFT_335395 [Aplosporella prunicola CBS 121167]KAF2140313.1 hypothetical protein K452DRAFT_335395 [Aplosporella prunicola CBS 121167]